MQIEGLKRVIGRFSGAEKGPMFLCVAALHGNELGGVVAAQEVLQLLNTHRPQFCGDAVFLAGNLRAIAAGKRFIDEDLNRAWTFDRVHAHQLVSNPHSHLSESHEQRELMAEIENCINTARGPLYFIDLHSVSSESQPFQWVCDQGPSKQFAQGIPIPAVRVGGTGINGFLMDYMLSLGASSIAIEGGQHVNPQTAVNHKNALLCALASSGNLLECSFAPLTQALSELDSQKGSIPHDLEVIYRHGLKAGDGFRMRAGFKNFQQVTKGVVLAEDNSGELCAPEEGYVFMPLYQAQGDDGFFLVKPAN